MNESLADYIANLIASALLASNDEKNNDMLRDEHQKVLNKIIGN